jgi:hypothetical protein
MKKILITGLWLLCLYLQASANEVEWYVFNTSGGEANGGGWGIDSSIGQSICGNSAAGVYSCDGGYISGSGLQQEATFTLMATAISPTLVRLEWSNIENETGFEIERREEGSIGYSKIIELVADTTSFDDTYQLKEKTLYDYKITASGIWAYATATVRTKEAKDNFIPYHNLFHPLKGEKVSIYYKITSPAPVLIRLYNLAGELVKTLVDEDKGAGQYWIDWSGKNEDGALCAAGTYVIQIKTGSFKESKKIILIK